MKRWYLLGGLVVAGCTQFPAAPTDAAADDGRTDVAVDLGVDSAVADAGPTDTGPGDVATADIQTLDIATADGGTADVVNDVASGDLGAVDAGAGDTGVSDVGIDAGATDAGPIDTGSTDAGPGDAGGLDVNPTDSGPADAGPQDTGVHDLGPGDVGPTDLGPADTGPACAPPATLCGSSCVSLADDVMHCGACTMVCPAPARANAVSACVTGSCGSTCAPGFDDLAGECVAIAAPRPIAPLSSSVVTSRRPRLRWANEGRLDGAVIELCLDRNCTRPIGAPIRVTGVEVTLPVSLDPGVVFWRLRGRIGSREGLTTYSATWQFTVGHRDTPLATSWGNASHDVNGDGYDDVVVSATGERRVYVYYGSASGITTTGVTTISESASDYGVPRIVGDLDGDHFADVVVGSAAARTIYIYRGGNGGLSTTATTIISTFAGFGGALATAGDVNGDGFADVVVGAPHASCAEGSLCGRAVFYTGHRTSLLVERLPVIDINSHDRLIGRSVSCAGDVNGDGFSDVIVGGSGTVGLVPGFVYVFAGDPMVSLRRLFSIDGQSSGVLTHLGYRVSAAGDQNGDGFADFLAGSWPSIEALNRGVWLMRGGAMPGSLPMQAYTDPTSTGFGAELTGGGDFNGDGNADLAIGDNVMDTVAIYQGTGAGPGTTNRGVRGVAGELFGVPVVAGDVNADGYVDLLVGASGYNGRDGRVYVFHGSSAGIGATAATILNGTAGARGDFGAIVD